RAEAAATRQPAKAKSPGVRRRAPPPRATRARPPPSSGAGVGAARTFACVRTGDSVNPRPLSAGDHSCAFAHVAGGSKLAHRACVSKSVSCVAVAAQFLLISAPAVAAPLPPSAAPPPAPSTARPLRPPHVALLQVMRASGQALLFDRLRREY